jgi:amino acid permease
VFKWAGLVPTLQSFPVIVFAYTCHQNVSITLINHYVAYLYRCFLF